MATGGEQLEPKTSWEALLGRGHMVLLEGLAGVDRHFPRRQRWDSGRGGQTGMPTEKGPQGKIQKHRQAYTSYLLCPSTRAKLLTAHVLLFPSPPRPRAIPGRRQSLSKQLVPLVS